MTVATEDEQQLPSNSGGNINSNNKFEEESKEDAEEEESDEEDEEERRAEELRKQEQEKQRNIEIARAAVNEGEDDSAEEKAKREDAKVLLKEYAGDAFLAVRKDDKEILEAYFLVHGSKEVLGMRDRSVEGGAMTLLHAAAFWGSMNCLEYLLQVGADVEAIDTALSGTTPLIEAARAGHLNACKRLIAEGASIKAQDRHGDTVFHWSARKGRGTFISHLLNFAEKYHPGSTDGVLDLENIRNRTAHDVSANHSVLHLIKREMENAGKRLEIAKMKKLKQKSKEKRKRQQILYKKK